MTNAKINFSSTTIRAGGDAKTTKGNGDKYITAIMYLAPFNVSGAMNTCAMAEKAGCVSGCLFKAGRGAFNSVEQARVNKTLRFAQDRDGFMRQLFTDVERFARYCAKHDAAPCVRLNGTSDIRWENHKVDGLTVFEAFPDVQFYDYTKIANRRVSHLPNYDLTWSYSEANADYAAMHKIAIEKGLNIAVVFRTQEHIPATSLGLPVVDGDKDDLIVTAERRGYWIDDLVYRAARHGRDPCKDTKEDLLFHAKRLTWWDARYNKIERRIKQLEAERVVIITT